MKHINVAASIVMLLAGCSSTGVSSFCHPLRIVSVEADGSRMVLPGTVECVYAEPSTGCATRVYERTELWGLVRRSPQRIGPWACPPGRKPVSDLPNMIIWDYRLLDDRAHFMEVAVPGSEEPSVEP